MYRLFPSQLSVFALLSGLMASACGEAPMTVGLTDRTFSPGVTVSESWIPERSRMSQRFKDLSGRLTGQAHWTFIEDQEVDGVEALAVQSLTEYRLVIEKIQSATGGAISAVLRLRGDLDHPAFEADSKREYSLADFQAGTVGAVSLEVTVGPAATLWEWSVLADRLWMEITDEGEPSGMRQLHFRAELNDPGVDPALQHLSGLIRVPR